ncbi:MAG: TIR domain-containing protein, partial [Candidatus Tectomicrobia bacterium]|nr:TIR domain-containing protein [Candidatus Tectomicrobia bacterium]
SWERTLYRKLRACRAVIALCTDHYLRSNWCFAEIALARMEGKHLIALQVDPLSSDTPMPSILTEKQFIDLRTNVDEGYRRLWRGLKEMDLLGVAGEWEPNKSPYLGLDAYQEEHAPVFFGREDETQSAIEVLARGAPRLIMALGASGSGKSSLVRAGVLPRLRREPDRWLVVNPFRPGRDPFAELAGCWVQACRRYAPDEASRIGRAEDIRDRLEAGATQLVRQQARAVPPSEDGGGDVSSASDERLQRLMGQLEELSRQPPEPASRPLLDFLNWSVEDLRRICAAPSPSGATPGEALDSTPLVELADHLRRVSERRDARVLLVIDQFEEALGHDEHDDLCHRFLTLLRVSLEVEHSPLIVLGTMRSDFLGVFQHHAALRDIDFESLSLGPMKTEGMRRVIEEPAKLGTIELESGLADRLIADTETPDALPLLSFTLWVLWRDYHQNGKLDTRDYEALGGLHGAVATEADALLASATRDGKAGSLQRAFLHMARLTESGGYARQPVQWEMPELRPVHPILERFVERRLLVSRAESGSRMVEVAHEALFRSWQPLKTWLDNHRAELLLRQQLQRDAEVWEANHRAADNLWRGGRLQQAQELMRQGGRQVTTRDDNAIAAFVQAGVRRRNYQRWTMAGITCLVFIILAGFLGYAFIQRTRAEEQARIAEEQARIARAQTQLAEKQTEKFKISMIDLINQAADEVAAKIESRLSNWMVQLRTIRDEIDERGVELSDDNLQLTQRSLVRGIENHSDIVALQLFIEGVGHITPMKDYFRERLSQANVNPDEVFTPSQDDLPSYFVEKDISVKKLQLIPETDDWLTTILVPLTNKISDQNAVLAARINLDWLRQFLQQHRDNQLGKTIRLIDAEGKAILSDPKQHYDDNEIVEEALDLMGSDNISAITRPYTRPDGEARLGTFRFLHSFPWTVILDRKAP